MWQINLLAYCRSSVRVLFHFVNKYKWMHLRHEFVLLFFFLFQSSQVCERWLHSPCVCVCCWWMCIELHVWFFMCCAMPRELDDIHEFKTSFRVLIFTFFEKKIYGLLFSILNFRFVLVVNRNVRMHFQVAVWWWCLCVLKLTTMQSNDHWCMKRTSAIQHLTHSMESIRFSKCFYQWV